MKNNNFKPKGNILVLVILILTASSLMGILARSFLKNFIVYQSQIYHHQKASSMMKAGLELGLAMVENREIWFEYTIEEGANPLTGNFIYCGEDCNFSLEIEANAPAVVQNYREFWDQCEDKEYAENRIVLNPWVALAIPLFRDKGVESIQEALIKISDKNKNMQKNQLDVETVYPNPANLENSQIKIIVTENSFKAEPSGSKDLRQIRADWNINNYYLIRNESKAAVEICLKSKNETGMIPQENSLIESFGSFRNTILWKRAIFKKGIPEFLKGDAIRGNE